MLNKDEITLLNDSGLTLLGFGSQGEAEATNLRRSGVFFKIGLRPGTSWDKALKLGFQPLSIGEALQGAKSVVMNLSDESQKTVYEEFLASRKIERLVFAHGFNTHFGRIPVLESGPKHCLVAPKGAASGLKEFYGTANALPALLAVKPEMTGSEKIWCETYAKAIGCHEKFLIWADFKDETDCDLFAEQALLCGGVSQLLRSTYEVLIEAGYNPEAAYFETLYELKLIVDLIWREGITGMRKKISPTARYGDVTRGDRVIDASVKERMKVILSEIQSGKFAEEFLAKQRSSDYLNKLSTQSEHPLEKIGSQLRLR